MSQIKADDLVEVTLPHIKGLRKVIAVGKDTSSLLLIANFKSDYSYSLTEEHIKRWGYLKLDGDLNKYIGTNVIWVSASHCTLAMKPLTTLNIKLNLKVKHISCKSYATIVKYHNTYECGNFDTDITVVWDDGDQSRTTVFNGEQLKYFLIVDQGSPLLTEQLLTKLCCYCGKSNEVGVSVCWSCVGINP